MHGKIHGFLWIFPWFSHKPLVQNTQNAAGPGPPAPAAPAAPALRGASGASTTVLSVAGSDVELRQGAEPMLNVPSSKRT